VVQDGGIWALTSDWDLFERALGGDERAWRILVGCHGRELTKMALLITGSVAVAQDLVQESFIELSRKPPRHRQGSLRGYLSTVVYHRSLKEKAKAASVCSLEGIEVESPQGSPLERLVTKEKDRAIAAAIMSLDSPHRDVLILRFYGGHGYEEIARMTGVPLGTVKSQIFYAVKKCRERLRKEGWFE
jgi:RNA polymerase sigma-70 factor (ECF subfamily)